MGIREMVEGFLFKVALKKGIKAAVTFIVALLASAKVAPIITQAGVTIDPMQLEIGLTTLGTALITMLLNYLKTKTSVGKKLL